MRRLTPLLLVLVLPACALAVPTPTPRPAPTIGPAATPTTRVVTVGATIAAATPAPDGTVVLPMPGYDGLTPADPAWAVVGFLRGWRDGEEGAMAATVQPSGTETPRDRASALRTQFAFKVLRGAELLGVEARGPTIARATVRVWYEFPPGRVTRALLHPMLERDPTRATPGPGTPAWRINPSSVLGEQPDP